MLDRGGAEHAAEEGAEMLRRQAPSPTTRRRSRQREEIGRHESRRVDEPKPRHRQHAVRKLADVVSRQIGGHFLLELGFGTGFSVHERAIIRLTSSQSGHAG